MKYAAYLLLFALLAPLPADAAMLDGHTYPDEWFACAEDSECVPYYGCEDIGINKNFVDAYRDVLAGCDASAVHDANAKVGCVNSVCAVVSPPPRAETLPAEEAPADSPATE